MKIINLKRLFENEKALFLAYDQGIEHGPVDFNARNIDPDYAIQIAIQGRYNGLIVQKGIAEHYYEHYHRKVPLILKLNGKTNINRGFPIARQICSVKKAVELGADAVGYTVYVGSPLEPDIFAEFSKIQEEAHDYGLPVIAWMYPQGRYVVDELSTSMISYAARVGLELGADIIKIKYNDKPEEFKWIVRCAGNVKVVAAGGPKLSDKHFLTRVRHVMDAGASGMAIGREVWQHETPLKMTAAIKKIIFENAELEEAIGFLK